MYFSVGKMLLCLEVNIFGYMGDSKLSLNQVHMLLLVHLKILGQNFSKLCIFDSFYLSSLILEPLIDAAFLVSFKTQFV